MGFDQKSAAAALSALGHEVRLHVYRLLVKAGPDGLNVGQIGTHLGMPASTLAHHLTALVHADLVAQERQGRIILNRAKFDQMDALVAFLSDECCSGVETTANNNVA